MQGNNAQSIQINSVGQMAVIDLGSNSFQMLLVEVLGGRIVEIARFREKIQLAAGLDVNSNLQETVLHRAYQCLRGFAEHLVGIECSNIRIVGTDALRRAVNRKQFVDNAAGLLGAPVQIISGEEEAKLIYRGAIASVDQPELVSLVMDIGGGSTELAVGQGSDVIAQASIALGCVDYTRRFFSEQKTDQQQFLRVVRLMRQTLGLLPEEIRVGQWQQAIGTSGTIASIERVLVTNEWCPKGISKAGLMRLVSHICSGRPIDELDIKGISADRADIFIAGVAITLALFEELDLQYLKTSPQALKEGFIYAMLDDI